MYTVFPTLDLQAVVSYEHDSFLLFHLVIYMVFVHLVP